jgi:hypothetical protein
MEASELVADGRIAMRNPELYEAMKRYAEAAIAFLQDKCEPEISIEREWHERPDSGGVFDLEEREVVQWTFCIRKNEAGLHGLPEYAELVRVIEADNDLRRQVGHQITVGSGSHLLEMRFLTDSVVARSAANSREMRFDPERFEADYQYVESGLYANEVEYEWLAPLPGFTGDSELIVCSDRLSIVRMDERQVIDCLRVGLIRGMPDDPTFRMITHRYAVRIKESAPKQIDAPLAELRSTLDVLEEVESVVVPLRLYKEERITVAGFLHSNVTTLVGQGRVFSTYALSPPGRWSAYHLRAEEEQDVIDLRDAIQREQRLAIAIRRFGDAGERRRSEDRLLDLMIAAEQLFLTGERQELGFKLALRAAFFLEDDAQARQEVFSLMGRGYNVRSDLVHANQSRVRKLLPTLEGLNRQIERLIRKGLLKALQQAGTWPLDSDQWNSIILNPQDPLRAEQDT